MKYVKLLIGLVVSIVSAEIMMQGAMVLSSPIGISALVIGMSVLAVA